MVRKVRFARSLADRTFQPRTSPQRIDPSEGVSRRKVDAYQAKWDKWDDDAFVEAASKQDGTQGHGKQAFNPMSNNVFYAGAKGAEKQKKPSASPGDSQSPFSSSGEEESFERWCWIAVGTVLVLVVVATRMS